MIRSRWTPHETSIPLSSEPVDSVGILPHHGTMSPQVSEPVSWARSVELRALEEEQRQRALWQDEGIEQEEVEQREQEEAIDWRLDQTEVADDEMADDEMADDEMADDEMADDEMADDEPAVRSRGPAGGALGRVIAGSFIGGFLSSIPAAACGGAHGGGAPILIVGTILGAAIGLASGWSVSETD